MQKIEKGKDWVRKRGSMPDNPIKIEAYQCTGCRKQFIKIKHWKEGIDDPISPCCSDHFTDQEAVDAGRSCSRKCCEFTEEEAEASLK